MTKKITTFCCTVALLATTPALSQTKGFEGLNIALGMGATTGTASVKDSGFDIINESTEAGKRNFIYSGDISYNFPVSGKVSLGIGATYDFNKTKIGDQKLSFGEAVLADTGYTEISSSVKGGIKNHYSVYVQPSYLVNNTTAVFGKLGYHQAKSYFNATTLASDGAGDVVSDTLSRNQNHNGIGYGIGIKTFLESNVYIQAEVEYVDYNSKTLNFSDVTDGATTSIKPKTTSGRISIGYKF